MAIYFLSDAHLGAEDDKNESIKIKKLFDFLNMVEGNGEKLYILGDLFDFWFEYKHAIPKQHLKAVFKLASLAESGVEIHYITGNHDFWLGDFLEKEVGITIHRDQLEVNENGLKLFLIHGDGLSPADWKYRIFVRSILRNRLAIALYRLLPPDWGIPFAKKMSSSSRNHTSGRNIDFTKDYELYAESKFAEGYDAVLIGHVHQPAFKKFENGIYINTGDFYYHFSYAKLENSCLTLEQY
ncbi:MAG: UDP-2,3-diacylglucosamine diphosphatase [candidate division Zixibacteria bacterium]|nr:UDP-2,3-diacylglucosamine diphosphatase [candidate division Zixibacteria bacterium]